MQATAALSPAIDFYRPKGSREVLENERDVVVAWRNGNKRAYEALVRHYMSDAYATAFGFVGDADDAWDLSQDAFIKAYQARERFDADRPFYPWLYRILKNHCLNFLKRRRKTSPLYYDGNPDRERFRSPGPTPLAALEDKERRRLVRLAVDALSDDHREIIVLKSFKGHSYKEIAEILDIPLGTVMSRLYYARHSLREIIERIETDGYPDAVGALPAGDPTTGEVL